MCLSTISKRKPKSSGVGYKVFDTGTTGHLCSPIHNDTNYLKGRWYTARPSAMLLAYPAGFHIFKNKKEAMGHWVFGPYRVILKVRYSGAHTQGIDTPARTVVAKRMYIYKKDHR